MEIPDKLKIGGMVWRVFFEEHLSSGRELFGETRFMSQEIAIEKRAHPQRCEETLLHEIIEVINHNCELKLEHYKITALASCLYQVLKDNNLVFFDENSGREPKGG